MNDAARKAIDLALAGNVSVIGEIQGFTDEELLAATASEQLILSSVAVIKVLKDLADGVLEPQAVQSWASFVRNGIVGPHNYPVHPLLIEYDSEHEDAIADAVARMDDIGDLIDGVLSNDEIARLAEDLAK